MKAKQRSNIVSIEEGFLITFKDKSTSFIQTKLRKKENNGDDIPNGSYV